MKDLIQEYNKKVLKYTPRTEPDPRINIEIMTDPISMSTIVTGTAMMMGKQYSARTSVSDLELRGSQYTSQHILELAAKRVADQLEERVNQELYNVFSRTFESNVTTQTSMSQITYGDIIRTARGNREIIRL